MEIIDSFNNKKVMYWTKLNYKKYRDEEDLFLVEGDHLVSEALKYDVVKEIITTDINYHSLIPFYIVTDKVMKKISNQVTSTNIIAVCHKLNETSISDKVLLLDNISDPGNLGTIIRSSIAFGFNTIFLSNDSVDLYNDKVIRSTEGMIFQTNVIRCDLNIKIDELKSNGYKIVGTSLNKDNNYEKSPKIALLMGNEGLGVKPDLSELCDYNYLIKMNNSCESLNVGVATSIIMYEMSDYHE